MKKNVRKMVAVLLAMVLTLGALPVVAMAEEADTRAVPICSHEYTLAHYNAYYTQLSDTQHTYHEISVYVCLLCDAEYEETYEVDESHAWVFIGHTWSGFRYQCRQCDEIGVFSEPLELPE